MHLAFDARAWTKPPHSFRRVLRLLVDAARGAGWPVELWRTAAFQPGFEAFAADARDASAGVPAGSRAEALWSPQMDVLPCALPTVATIHDVNPLLEDGRGWFARWTRRRKFHRLLRAAAPQVRAYATDTEDARGRILSFFPWLQPSLGVVPLYVESGFTAPASAHTAAVLARHALSPGYFLFVGSLRRHKNWEGLVRAFARLPDALRRERPLVLVGPAHRAQAEVHRLTRRLGVAAEVRCTGAVEDTDLPALYAGARAFVFPSFLEGFGLPPLEAMALGVPVISSNRTCLPEVLGDAPLYIDPADPAELAVAMERLAGDDPLHTRLAEAGLARCRHFHAARTADAMRTLLDRLPASPPVPR
jgi:glycosyltransferase involved in cell wall biosynthesis